MQQLPVTLEHYIALPSVTTPKGVVILSHGMNNGFDSSLVTLLKEAFITLGYVSIAYNFTYLSEDKEPSQGLTNELGDITQIVEGARSLFPNLPLHLIGKSLGGIVSSWYAREHISTVASVGILGYVLGKESIDWRSLYPAPLGRGSDKEGLGTVGSQYTLDTWVPFTEATAYMMLTTTSSFRLNTAKHS
jgi:alpha-beta hydrolase superfamily lysophospholipase